MKQGHHDTTKKMKRLSSMINRVGWYSAIRQKTALKWPSENTKALTRLLAAIYVRVSCRETSNKGCGLVQLLSTSFSVSKLFLKRKEIKGSWKKSNEDKWRNELKIKWSPYFSIFLTAGNGWKLIYFGFRQLLAVAKTSIFLAMSSIPDTAPMAWTWLKTLIRQGMAPNVGLWHHRNSNMQSSDCAPLVLLFVVAKNYNTRQH